MIKALIFDLDQTLVDRNTSLHRFIELQHEHFQDQMPDIRRSDYLSAVRLHDQNGYKPKQELFDKVCQTLNIKNISPDSLIRHYRDHFGFKVVLFPHTREVIEQLSLKYRLGMITNGTDLIQNRKIDASGIRPYFQSILISESAGVAKPDPRIFQLSLQELGLPPEQCLFVGDHPRNDIAPAHAAGMKTVWMRNDLYTLPPQADYSIDDIRELLEILESLH